VKYLQNLLLPIDMHATAGVQYTTMKRTKTNTSFHRFLCVSLCLVILSSSVGTLSASEQPDIRQLSKFIDDNPYNETGYLNRGLAYLDQMKLDEALHDLSKAIELYPDYAAAFSYRGQAYYQQGNYEKSIKDYTMAVELNPNDADAWSGRGLCYNEMGFYDKAIADHNKAIDINSQDPGLFINRGLAYSAMQSQQSIACNDFYQAGYLYLLEGDKREATECVNRIRESEPYSPLITRLLTEIDKGVVVETTVKTVRTDVEQIKENPGKSLDYYDRGELFTKQGEFDKAIADFTSAITLTPSFVAGYLRRAEIYAVQGQFKEAIADYSSALHINPRIAKTYYSRALIHTKTGDYERAIEDLSEAIELNPQYGEAYYQRGLAYAEYGEYKKAQSNMNLAVKLLPEKSADAFFDLGSVSLKHNMIGVACNDLYEAGLQYLELNMPEQAVKCTYIIRENDPQWPFTDKLVKKIEQQRMLSGNAPLTTENAASPSLETLISDGESNTVPLNAVRDYIEGTISMNLGDYAGAAARFSDVLKADPVCTTASYRRGLALHYNKEYDNAQECFSQVIAGNPRHLNAWHMRAASRYEKGDMEGALQDLSIALEINPHFSLSYFNRAIVQYVLGYYDSAIRDMNQAIALNPALTDAYNLRGLAYYENGDCAEATRDFSKGLELSKGNNYVAYYGRGLSYARMYRHLKAVRDFDKAIELNKKCSDSYLARANSLIKLEKVQDAMNDYTHVIELNPQLADAYFFRGIAFSNQSLPVLACSDLYQAGTLYVQQQNKVKADRCVEIMKNAFAVWPLTEKLAQEVSTATVSSLPVYCERKDFLSTLVTPRIPDDNLVRTGEYLGALSEFSRCIERNNKDHAAVFNRGLVHYIRREYDDALRDFSAAVEMSKDGTYYLYRAMTCYAKGEYDRAVEDCSAAVDRDPENPLLYYTSALACAARNTPVTACNNFYQAGLLYHKQGNESMAWRCVSMLHSTDQRSLLTQRLSQELSSAQK
jgi:tetratricopeptide (TPR) repeat protein